MNICVPTCKCWCKKIQKNGIQNIPFYFRGESVAKKEKRNISKRINRKIRKKIKT